MNKEYVIKAIVDDNDYRKIIGYFIDGKAYYLKNNSNKYDQKTSKKIIKNHGKEIKKALQTTKITEGMTKRTYKVLYTKPAQKKLRKRIAAGAIGLAMTFGLASAMTSSSPTFAKTKSTKKIEQQKDTNLTAEEIINQETNPNIKKYYKQLLKYSNGKKIIKTFYYTLDKNYKNINKVAIKNPDAKGKISYIEYEELAAIHDVYNARNNEKTLLEDAETIRCNYFTGQAALINLSQGSQDVQEIDTLFKDNDLKIEQQELQKETQITLNKKNIATKSFIQKIKSIFKSRTTKPELQAEVAFGQPGLSAALTPQLKGIELKKFQKSSKEEGGQLSELIFKAAKDSKKIAVEKGQIDLEKQRIINEIMQEKDKEFLKDYDRTDFNPATTKKGKEMLKAYAGGIGITQQGKYVVITKTNTITKTITREEAKRILGNKKLTKLENKVLIDTNGDGKNDTPLDKANRDSKKQGQNEANDRARGYEAGQRAFVNGGSSTTSTGSKAYQEGYKAGYAHAKSVYNNQKDKTDKTVEKDYTEKEKPTTPTKPSEPTTPTTPEEPTTPTEPVEEEPPVIEEWHDEEETTKQRQQVKEIKSYTKETEPTIEIEMNDGTAYKTRIRRA